MQAKGNLLKKKKLQQKRVKLPEVSNHLESHNHRPPPPPATASAKVRQQAFSPTHSPASSPFSHKPPPLDHLHHRHRH